MAFLSVKNMKKTFGNNEVLKGIDVEIERGEVFAVIGESGGGKTTFLRCLNLLESLDDGEVLLDGELKLRGGSAMNEAQKLAYRQNFGLIFQNFNLFPQYSVLDNVLMPLLNREAKLNKKIPNQRVSELRAYAQKTLDDLGLREKYDSYPCQLSGGQSQRVAIARALVLQPKILCFDEPTSALDPKLTVEIAKIINRLKEQGQTMIIITHDMEFAKAVADRVCFIYQGQIEESGAPAELFANPKSTHLMQFINSAGEEDVGQEL